MMMFVFVLRAPPPSLPLAAAWGVGLPARGVLGRSGPCLPTPAPPSLPAPLPHPPPAPHLTAVLCLHFHPAVRYSGCGSAQTPSKAGCQASHVRIPPSSPTHPREQAGVRSKAGILSSSHKLENCAGALETLPSPGQRRACRKRQVQAGTAIPRPAGARRLVGLGSWVQKLACLGLGGGGHSPVAPERMFHDIPSAVFSLTPPSPTPFLRVLATASH